MSQTLPERPHLDWYRKAAKKKLAALQAEDPSTRLADAQLLLAREHGFSSWRKLVAAMEVAQQTIRALFAAVRAGDVPGVRRLLAGDPQRLSATDDRGNTLIRAAMSEFSRSAVSLVDLFRELGIELDIFSAAQLGDERRVRQLLARDAALARAIDGCCGFTALCWAGRCWNAASGIDCSPHARCAELLIDAGADVHFRDTADLTWTPLHHAAEWWTVTDVAETLLARGADINARTTLTGQTPLDLAIGNKRGPMIELLRSRGGKQLKDLPPLSAPTPDETLVKAFANAIHGDVGQVRQMLEAHPVLTNATIDGHTMLHHAAGYNRVDAIRLLIERGADPNAYWTNTLHTPLSWAVTSDWPEAWKALIEGGATIDLFCAAGMGELDRVKSFFDENGQVKPGASISGSTRTRDDGSRIAALNDPAQMVSDALYIACRCGQVETAIYLLERGADPNFRAYMGATCFHWAHFGGGDPRLVEAILAHGGDPNAIYEERNCTPRAFGILVASSWGWPYYVRRILQIDPSLATLAEGGTTPLQEATRGGHTEVGKILIEHGAQAPAEEAPARFLKLVSDGDLAGVKAMLDADPSLVNAVAPHPTWGGRPQALHVAIERDHREIFDLLLERGADPRGDNAAYDHWSPAMLARHWRRPEMLAELRKRLGPDDLFLALMDGNDDRALELLADPAALDRPMPNDATPLHFATTVPPALRMLELGVPIDAKDKYGKTPLMLAAEKNRLELAAFLVTRGATPTLEIAAALGQVDWLTTALDGAVPGDALIVAAVEAKQHATVSWMLGQKANPNARSAKGSKATLLHSAAWNGDLAMVKLLIAAGADLGVVDEEHKTTPLVWAQTARKFTGNTACDAVIAYLEQAMSDNGPHVEFLKLAVSPHRDDSTASYRQATAMLKTRPTLADANIFTAAVAGRSGTITKLLKRNPKLATTAGGPKDWQPLSYLAFSRFLRFDRAREKDFLKSARLLLKAGADPNTFWQENPSDPKSMKESALYGAAGVANNTAMTGLLLDAGADPNDGESLYHACEFKNNDILKRMHEAGAAAESWSYCVLRKLDFDDFAGLQFMLDRGADPNHRHPGNGRTALFWAIMRDRGLKFIKAILAAGGDVDVADKEGMTPYLLARRLGRTDVAELLLKHGAVDKRTAQDQFVDACVLGDAKEARAMLKRTPGMLKAFGPLHLRALPDAAARGNLAGVKTMLDLGFPVDTPGDWGGTALHQAAWNDHPDIVKLLLKRGARIDVRQQWDGDALHTLLHCAKVGKPKHAAESIRAMVQSGQVNDVRKYMPENPDEPGADKVIKLLTPYLPKHSDDPVVKALPAHRMGHKIAQWKPIMDAAYNGDAERIKKLLREGADPNIVSTTPARYRPLHRAIERKKSFKRGPKDIAAVKALLAGAADPHQLGMWGKHTALGMAAVYEPLFVPVLIDYFKPLDIIHAAAVGDEDRVAELLKKDRKLATARNEVGWTPLHYAAASRMHEVGKSSALLNIARMLLKAGADIMAAWNYNDEWPLRPLYYAAGWSNHPAMVELLLQNGADACDSESTYHAADENYTGCLAMIEKYTPAKKLAKECTSCLPTQLHWGRTRGAKWLLEHGADPNAVSERYGKSALQIAAENGASEGVIALLLKHGGDPKATNPKGQSAIDLAKAAGKARVVEQLRKA